MTDKCTDLSGAHLRLDQALQLVPTASRGEARGDEQARGSVGCETSIEQAGEKKDGAPQRGLRLTREAPRLGVQALQAEQKKRIVPNDKETAMNKKSLTMPRQKSIRLTHQRCISTTASKALCRLLLPLLLPLPFCPLSLQVENVPWL